MTVCDSTLWIIHKPQSFTEKLHRILVICWFFLHHQWVIYSYQTIWPYLIYWNILLGKTPTYVEFCIKWHDGLWNSITDPFLYFCVRSKCVYERARKGGEKPYCLIVSSELNRWVNRDSGAQSHPTKQQGSASPSPPPRSLAKTGRGKQPSAPAAFITNISALSLSCECTQPKL